MAILKIVKVGDPTLRKKSKTVDAVTPRILTLLDDMRETLQKANGAGLAAVQVGVLRRIVLVVDADENMLELINPEIIKTEGKQNAIEGCLSVPDKWGVTDRPETVTVRAMNRSGEIFTVTGSGLTARAFCHELDHLDGILFTDNAIKILTPEEIEELREENE